MRATVVGRRLGGRPAGDARDRGARRFRLQAAAGTAAALVAVGFDDDVADVPGVAAGSVEQAAVGDDAAADAGRHDHPEVVAPARGRADPTLAERERLGVVVDRDRQTAMCAARRARSGKPRHAGMLSGETCSPPTVHRPAAADADGARRRDRRRSCRRAASSAANSVSASVVARRGRLMAREQLPVLGRRRRPRAWCRRCRRRGSYTAHCSADETRSASTQMSSARRAGRERLGRPACRTASSSGSVARRRVTRSASQSSPSSMSALASFDQAVGVEDEQRAVGRA